MTSALSLTPFGLSLSKACISSSAGREGQGFDNDQVRMSPGHSQPCWGHGDLIISPNGGGIWI